ncbi:hypothetical protein IXO367_19340, partial [Xanthomonas oryzae pv. oryzae]
MELGIGNWANSTLIRNAFEDLLGEDFEGRFESKYLSRTIVEPLFDRSQVRIGDGADIGLWWQVFAGEFLWILVCAAP